MRALDSILQESEALGESPPTDVANTVYRLLLKKEKQKAYESLVTIQSEIYDLQGKCSGRREGMWSGFHFSNDPILNYGFVVRVE